MFGFAKADNYFSLLIFNFTKIAAHFSIFGLSLIHYYQVGVINEF